MPRMIDIDWSKQTEENKEILLSLGFKPPKKRKKKAAKVINLKDNGVPIKLRRNIRCSCCKSVTVEYVTSYVPKELVSKNREAITDMIRTCKMCVAVLSHCSRNQLIDKILEAHRNYNF